ncbi:MAG: hypothetical protein MK212_19710 [Saprospiraceae bacterium]|nr:hypothetical protein [Saprospiraceae bacterium]
MKLRLYLNQLTVVIVFLLLPALWMFVPEVAAVMLREGGLYTLGAIALVLLASSQIVRLSSGRIFIKHSFLLTSTLRYKSFDIRGQQIRLYGGDKDAVLRFDYSTQGDKLVIIVDGEEPVELRSRAKKVFEFIKQTLESK